MDSWQTAIRIPMNLYERIREDAEKETRTITGQIIYMLKMYYETKDNFRK